MHAHTTEKIITDVALGMLFLGERPSIANPYGRAMMNEGVDG